MGNITVMGLLSLGDRGLTDEEIMLGTPDESEAKDLAHHVSRCAYRYKLFTKRQAAQGSDIQQVKYLMFGLFALVGFTNPQVRELYSWVAQIF